MDRDLALQLVQKITAVNGALDVIVANTAPASSGSRDMTRMEPDNAEPDPEREAEPETEPEPVTRTTTRKK